MHLSICCQSWALTSQAFLFPKLYSISCSHFISQPKWSYPCSVVLCGTLRVRACTAGFMLAQRTLSCRAWRVLIHFECTLLCCIQLLLTGVWWSHNVSSFFAVCTDNRDKSPGWLYHAVEPFSISTNIGSYPNSSLNTYMSYADSLCM